MNPHRRTARIVVVFSAMLSVGFSCAKNPAAPSELPLGQPFELRVGATEVLRDGLTLTLDRVESDSRCPMDALCVWAGDAIVRVLVSQSPGGRVERELHTEPARSQVSYLAYSIKLVALAPYPRSDRRIRPEDYIATIVVSAP